MKIGTGFLPAGVHDHGAIHVDHRIGDAGNFREALHELL